MATIIMQTDFGREQSPRLEIKGIQDKRNMAYLLHELSFLPDIKCVEKRLEQINAKYSNAMEKHGTLNKEDQSKLIEGNKVKNELKTIFERIKTEYTGNTKFYKNRMDAMDWVPEEKDFLKYFKYWLRKYAYELIESEKG